MKKVVLGLVILVGATLGGVLYWQSCPEYVIYQVRNAFFNQDKEKFDFYVSTDRLIDQIVDELIAEIQQGKAPAWGYLMAPPKGEANAFAKVVDQFFPDSQPVKVKIKPLMKEQAVAKLDQHFLVPTRMPSSLNFQKAPRKKDFSFSHRRGECSKHHCVINLTVHHKSTAVNYLVPVQLKKVDGVWRVVELPGAIQHLKSAMAQN